MSIIPRSLNLISVSATATTPVGGGSFAEAVTSGEIIAGRFSLESAVASRASGSADLALLVWPVVSAFALSTAEIMGADKWAHASMGPWSVPQELAGRVRAVIALIDGVMIGAWKVTGFDYLPRTLPAGGADLGCTFKIELDARVDALIGRSVDPAIRTNIYMYAELDKLLYGTAGVT